jgi:methanol metabolism-related c-type cytochrome
MAKSFEKKGKRVKRFGFGLLAAGCFGLAFAMSLSGAAIAAQDPPAADAPPADVGTGKEAAPVEPTADEKAKAQKHLEESKAGKKKEVDGKWELSDGTPTYNVIKEGEAVKQVDWYTYSGWRRYHAECHVCHGPNAEGSSFAPALADSLKEMTYEKFLQVVSSGQRRDVGGTQFIMPALGDNKNVMCYIDDLYIYIKARASGDLPGGRLSADQRAEKPQVAKEYENSCLE